MANMNRIKDVLAKKGKTGKWLAGELGKSNCSVSKWCSNTIQPDLKHWMQQQENLEWKKEIFPKDHIVKSE